MKAAAANDKGSMTGFMGMGMAMNAVGNMGTQNLYAMGQQQNGWKCACGAVNNGNFCTNCGAKKPEQNAVAKCSKCGWIPQNGENTPKFCPECGTQF